MKSLPSLDVIISIFFKRENKFITSCCQPHLLLKLVIVFIMLSFSFQLFKYQLQWKVNCLWTLTLIAMTAAFKRTEKKFNGFWQVDMVEFLINERKLLMMKLDYIWSHLSTAFNSKKLFIALPQGMASTINNFAT